MNLLKAGSEVRDSKPQRPLLPPESLETAREASWAQRDGAEVTEGTQGEESVNEREAHLSALSPASGEQAALRCAAEEPSSADTCGHLDEDRASAVALTAAL